MFYFSIIALLLLNNIISFDYGTLLFYYLFNITNYSFFSKVRRNVFYDVCSCIFL